MNEPRLRARRRLRADLHAALRQIVRTMSVELHTVNAHQRLLRNIVHFPPYFVVSVGNQL
jgi:hypothetical protein